MFKSILVLSLAFSVSAIAQSQSQQISETKVPTMKSKHAAGGKKVERSDKIEPSDKLRVKNDAVKNPATTVPAAPAAPASH